MELSGPEEPGIVPQPRFHSIEPRHVIERERRLYEFEQILALALDGRFLALRERGFRDAPSLVQQPYDEGAHALAGEPRQALGERLELQIGARGEVGNGPILQPLQVSQGLVAIGKLDLDLGAAGIVGDERIDIVEALRHQHRDHVVPMDGGIVGPGEYLH